MNETKISYRYCVVELPACAARDDRGRDLREILEGFPCTTILGESKSAEESSLSDEAEVEVLIC